MNSRKKLILKVISMACILSICLTRISNASGVINSDSVLILRTQRYSIRIIERGFRFGIFKPNGTVVLAPAKDCGLSLLQSPIVDSRLVTQSDTTATFIVQNNVGVKAKVRLFLSDYFFKLSVSYLDSTIKGSIAVRTRGLSPAYGLADHAAFREPYSTEVSGFQSNYFGARSDGQSSRLVSNFVIFPKQGVACINLDPHKKIVKVTNALLVQGSFYTNSLPSMYYFVGDVKQIYSSFLKVRDEEGYKVYKPKYAWFGVGWEAWGALAWNTNYKTVTEDVDHYLSLGFPLNWVVLGSGFWPDEPRYFSTTSFGFWNKEKYPDPRSFIEHFHKEGLRFILGLRIAFIPNGPYTEEGIKKDYFYKKNGVARLFRLGFPEVECYFLDDHNPQAVKWYVSLCNKWKAYGVDGYKEDLYGYEIDGLPDDKLNMINAALMDKGVYIMGRNDYVGSPMDISRYNDFNYDQDQDRGPVNGLAFAYSGFPNVYPDIIGGTGLTNKQFGSIEKRKIEQYLMREAQYAAVNPSMSFGYGPWNFDNSEVLKVCRNAAQLHERLHPYIYSSVIRAYKTGFPYTLTPLPLAYPHDSITYYRENEKVRGYQWLIGDALMAIPLYGNDYALSNSRNVFLPKGKWIDYDNGKAYQGPTILKNFPIPVDKTPLFVGGTGFVVEQMDGKLFGRIYPVGFDGRTIFYDKDGKTESEIIIKDFQSRVPVIKDMTTGNLVVTKYNRYAWQFRLIPGHNYQVQ